ncbi:MAG: UDP-N-acetylglucosamine 1-carboxyvinyltransferase [Bacillota bacterium]
MPNLLIRGGRPLRGAVRVGGRKNSAVAVLPAALLAQSESIIENLPHIDDVAVYLDILRAMGVKITQHRTGNGTFGLDPSSLSAGIAAPQDLVKRMRASYYLLGVLLGRFGQAEVCLPGGCDIGSRPIDQHLKGFRALGAEVSQEHGVVKLKASGGLTGADIYLDVASVGATINIMLAAVYADGTTIIENAAKEPHVVDVASYLNAAGARVQGAGTDVIRIKGVTSLPGCTHAIIPDDIEAATYMMAAGITRGDVQIENIIPKHLDPISAKLREAGLEVEENGDWIRVRGVARPRALHLKTLPYPGFPTDAGPPMSVLLSLAEGTSVVTEWAHDGRHKHLEELTRMGANVRVEGRTAIIEGVKGLSGAPVRATDLRAGAALVLAGLAAEGLTEVSGMEHVFRGYDQMPEKLAKLGADITSA